MKTPHKNLIVLIKNRKQRKAQEKRIKYSVKIHILLY